MSSTTSLINFVLILWCCVTVISALSCDSCGRECAAACGTRKFRTCCFNYLKKRSVEPPPRSGMRLELLMVVPELVHYYPSLRNLLTPPTLASTSGLKILYQDQKLAEDDPYN